MASPAKRKKRKHSSDLSDGEVLSSSASEAEEVDVVEQLKRKLSSAEVENSRLQGLLKRCQLDLENSQKYTTSLREHSELLTAKLQDHRTALKAGRDALEIATTQCSCPHLDTCPKNLTAKSSSSNSAPPPGSVALPSATQPVAKQPGASHGEAASGGNGVAESPDGSGHLAAPHSAAPAPLASEPDTAAVLASAAEEGMRQGGFLYDERSGMYYDCSSGYYYDSTSRLYYNNNTGIFYSRDPATGAFSEHHTVDISVFSSAADAGAGANSADDGDDNGIRLFDEDEDGLSQGSGGEADSNTESASTHAPCIRFIVVASEKLKVGDLSIVTCDGGTIGRDRDLGHCVRIPELVVSKVHAKIEYKTEDSAYYITDYGSRNGTYIDNRRLSESQMRSEPHVLSHGNYLQVGLHTRFLCHIHPAGETCISCEPGQVQAWLASKPGEDGTSSPPPSSHKETLNRLKNRYGLARRDAGGTASVQMADGCKDRAAARRSAVGVDRDAYCGPPAPSAAEAKPASMNRPIASGNRGRKMLEKLGWQDGDGLGQRQTGMSAPIHVQGQSSSRSGIGFSIAQGAAAAATTAPAGDKWEKAQARFQQVTRSEFDMFAD